MRSVQIRHSLLLFLAAVIWGVAFVAQSVSMDYVGPFTFICLRSVLGGLVLLPVIILSDRGKNEVNTVVRKTWTGPQRAGDSWLYFDVCSDCAGSASRKTSDSRKAYGAEGIADTDDGPNRKYVKLM